LATDSLSDEDPSSSSQAGEESESSSRSIKSSCSGTTGADLAGGGCDQISSAGSCVGTLWVVAGVDLREAATSSRAGCHGFVLGSDTERLANCCEGGEVTVYVSVPSLTRSRSDVASIPLITGGAGGAWDG
jgi:hypothetical protein